MANFPLQRNPYSGYPMNKAERYGIGIQTIHTDNPAWRVTFVEHLEPHENAGNHNVYIDTLDEQGRPLPQRPLFAWAGMRLDETPSPLELKNESGQAMYNIPMWPGQEVSVWLSGDSDKAVGFHTNHPVEGDGNNSPGHHSFYIVFQRIASKFAEQPQPEQPSKAKALLEQAIGLLVEARGLL